jgi:hypothetical protein
MGKEKVSEARRHKLEILMNLFIIIQPFVKKYQICRKIVKD